MQRIALLLALGIQLINAQSGSGLEDVTYISEPSDLEPLRGLTQFGGSLFFHSGTSISTTDLCMISDLEQIDGYLTIWRSPGIRNLKCLRNLKTIAGDELHFGHPATAVFIEDNVNQSTGVGMCFVDTLNWTLITNDPISIGDNGHGCPTCHSQCNTCWGAGPRLCQTCTNYRSGITCVESCPNGTIEDTVNQTCTEYQLPHLDMSQFSVQQELWNRTINVTFNWTNVSHPNGVPLGYRLLLDDEIVHEQVYEDYLPTNDGMVESSPLETSHEAYLNYSSNYTVQLQVLNSVGWSSLSENYTVTTMNAVPSAVENLNVSFDHNDTTVSWSPPSFTGGPLVRYHVLMGHYHNGNWSLHDHYVNQPNQTNLTMELVYSETYRACVRVYNQEWPSAPNCMDFTVPPEHPPAVSNLTVNVLNATFANASWSVEEEEHGHEDHDEHTHIVHLQLIDNDTDSHHEHHDHGDDTEDDILFETNNSYVVFDHLRPDSSYMLEVHCLHDYGIGEVARVNFTTPPLDPPVSNLTVDVLNATYATATWSTELEEEEHGHEEHDEHTHIVHLQLLESDDHHEHHEHGDDSDDDVLIETNNSYVVFDHLRPNSSYILEVLCLYDHGMGQVTQVNFSTPATNPPVPNVPTILNNTLTDIWINVEPVSDEHGYVTDYTLQIEHIEHGEVEETDNISLGRFTVNRTISLDSLIHLHDDHDYRLRLIAHVGNMSSSSSYSATSQLVSTTTTMSTITTTTVTDTHTVQQTDGSNDKDDNEFPLWLILLIVVCAAVVTAIIIIMVLIIRKTRKDRKNNGGDLAPTLRDSFANPMYTGVVPPNSGTGKTKKGPRETHVNAVYTAVSTGPTGGTKVLPHVDDDTVNVYDTNGNEYDTPLRYDFNEIKQGVPDMVPINMAKKTGTYVSVDGVETESFYNYRFHDDGTMSV